MFEEEWIKFYNTNTRESFSFEASTLVYIVKYPSDYDFSSEEGRLERSLDKIDAVKVKGTKLLVPIMAEQVKIGDIIYDEDGKYEGYRVE